MMRITIALIGFLSAVFLPPYVPLLCIAALSIRYRAWEALVLGLMMDFLWHPSGFNVHSLPYFTVAAIFIVWGLEPLRNELISK